MKKRIDELMDIVAGGDDLAAEDAAFLCQRLDCFAWHAALQRAALAARTASPAPAASQGSDLLQEAVAETMENAGNDPAQAFLRRTLAHRMAPAASPGEGDLPANWLSEDMKRVDGDIAAWPEGLRASFEKTHGAALARPQASAEAVPAERERIAEQDRHEIREIIYGHLMGLSIPLSEAAKFTERVDRAADAIIASRPTEPGGARGEIVRHVKRGTEYEVLFRGAELQVSVARGEPLELIETTLDPAYVCAEGDRLVVYRGADGKIWAREESEFDDGRFEPAARPASDNAGGN